ncbi:hypothetical protein R1flu_009879 [Riccia fluitans]|uniref:EXPERA domain-containing protein n=1 Tax=Riccia fluitans TaxID=41844 RepID=A0ABD1Z6D0_9MARC
MGEHPYCPSSLKLEGFIPIQFSPQFIASVFIAFLFLTFVTCWKITGAYYRHLGKADRALVGWWTIAGLVYLFLKGYYVFTPNFYKLQPSNFVTKFFNEFWKEYGKGDSRYMSRFPTIVLIEGFTAVIEGPASLLVVYAILYKKKWAHPLQFAASLTKFYGGVLYFSTAYLADTAYSVPGPVYFWGYFVLVKGLMALIPFIVVCRSWLCMMDEFSSSACTSTAHSVEKKTL